MNKNVQTLVKVLLSAALLVWLIQKLDWQLVVQELLRVNIWYILVFILFQLGAMLISVKKWQTIAEHHSLEFPLYPGFKTYLTGTFINNFLPSTIGGDIYRSLWLVGRGAEKGKAFSIVIFDRFNGLLITLLLATLGAFFVWKEVTILPEFLVFTYVVLAATLLFFCAAFFCIPEKYIAFVPINKLQIFLKAALQYRNKELWMKASWWGSLFTFIGLGVSNYILFLALGYTLPFMAFLGLVFVMALYVGLPISISNIGVKEWAYGVLFVLLGVSFETAVTVALLSRFLQTGISLFALPYYLTEKKEAIG